MKRLLWLILPFFLAACAAQPAEARQTPTQVAFDQTKVFGLTAEAGTQTSINPAEAATGTASMTATATVTVELSETPLPTVPASAPFCQPGNLQRYFGTSGATQQILISAGLKNKGTSACFLQVWPQVQMEDKQGRALDVDYGYFDFGFSVPGATATERAQKYATAKVGLWPGWSVWINLLWQNWCAAPVSGGTVIRLTFNNTGVINITTDVAEGGTCNAQGKRSYVGIAKMILMPGP